MADPFLGEIRPFAGNFAPRNWALCNGQLLSIAQNTALFSLLGTQFGGDGRVTFGLPNLQASVPLDQGQGPGLTPRDMGEVGGAPAVTLTTAEMPAHTHSYSGENVLATSTEPANNVVAGNRTVAAFTAPGMPGIQQVTMSPQGVGVSGGSAPHNNRQPFLAVTFIIALQGIFPQRQ